MRTVEGCKGSRSEFADGGLGLLLTVMGLEA